MIVPVWDFNAGIWDYSAGAPEQLTRERLFGSTVDQVCGTVDRGPAMDMPLAVTLSRPSGDAYLAQSPHALPAERVPACTVELEPQFAKAALEVVLDCVDRLARLGLVVLRGRHRHIPTYFETDLVVWQPTYSNFIAKSANTFP